MTTKTLSEVASIINDQMGGSRFYVMVKYKTVVYGEDFIRYEIPASNKNRWRFFEVKLDANDTYTVTFSKILRNFEVEKSVHSGVYVDMLHDLFTSETGFLTRL